MTTCKHKTRPNDKIQSYRSAVCGQAFRRKKESNSFLNLLGQAKSPRQNLYATEKGTNTVCCALLLFTFYKYRVHFYFLLFHSRKVIVSRLAFDAAVVHSSGHDITQIHKFTNIQIYDCQFIRKRKEQK